MSTTLIIWPHQLFIDHPGLELAPDRIVLFEDPLFFGDPRYPTKMHRQKLWLHRATMTRFQSRLEEAGHSVVLYDYRQDAESVSHLLTGLKKDGTQQILFVELVDYTANTRLQQAAEHLSLPLRQLPSPGWLNRTDQNQAWTANRKRLLMAEYYKQQRRRLDVLMDGDKPVGGQWSFDEDNRKKVPKTALSTIPELPLPEHDEVDHAARDYILDRYPDAVGSIEQLYYPTSHEQAAAWLDDFFKQRFEQFGDYEDAIVEGQSWLWHAVLTPMLNIGLLTPKQVLDRTLAYAARAAVPLNSLEGFIRQVIGWREFMRATYEDLGVRMRTTNHWRHTRSMPASFYAASTGIDPIDDTIQRILETGYCHHIERLMVLGGFMFLCEFDPDDVYRWFMELFIDSYDWVMVPNVYAMSQHADGGLITTKPYFSGSNYIRKMSHWTPGPWAEVWDGLYWRFIWKHRQALATNPRWAMMCRTVERMDEYKRSRHLNTAEAFLNGLR